MTIIMVRPYAISIVLNLIDTLYFGHKEYEWNPCQQTNQSVINQISYKKNRNKHFGDFLLHGDVAQLSLKLII